MPGERFALPNELHRPTLIALIAVIWFAYPTLVLSLGAERAIDIGNGVLLSLACGIVVAYTPDMIQSFRQKMIDGPSILAVGIWASWSGVVIARGTSMVWRILDQPVDWLNSPWWGTHIMFSATGALCHLIAPQAVGGRVPTRKLVRLGLIVALSVFFAAMLTMFQLS